ncbi:MAG: hypothetical protein F6K18_05445 [Okeania sp. SIO2C2]|uniref:hypothetical protein n=1 Tax=Okeania sp. SIO2C2 TaxID=2607787 RepID=UPI0013BCF3E1|nr:hypothetical protein [Okeania sp. SIO2C2]NEP86310.1 hypothetical protein [Okeania sp. SIO2C2]
MKISHFSEQLTSYGGATLTVISQVIVVVNSLLFITINQELYGGLFDQIKLLKIENPSCLECDVKIAEWKKKEEVIIL